MDWSAQKSRQKSYYQKNNALLLYHPLTGSSEWTKKYVKKENAKYLARHLNKFGYSILYVNVLIRLTSTNAKRANKMRWHH